MAQTNGAPQTLHTDQQSAPWTPIVSEPDTFLHSRLCYENYICSAEESGKSRTYRTDFEAASATVRVLDVAFSPQINLQVPAVGPSLLQRGSQCAVDFEDVNVEKLLTSPSDHVALRVILFPLACSPRKETLRSLLAIFNHYRLPGMFLEEVFHSVTHSFGSRVYASSGLGGEKVEIYQSWFQFLCKDFQVAVKPTDPATPHLEVGNNATNADYTWLKANYFLSWAPVRGDGLSSEFATSGDHQTAVNKTVTFICFGSLPETLLAERFRALVNTREDVDATINWGNVGQILNDPYMLYTIVLEEIFTTIDTKTWVLTRACVQMEQRVFGNIKSGTKPVDVNNETSTMLDSHIFLQLHNLAKHVIHLHEGAQAILETIGGMKSAHASTIKLLSHRNKHMNNFEEISEQVNGMLGYFEVLFRAPSLRLKSIEKRFTNVINLAFNLVAQQDSQAMKSESQTMTAIAAVTFIFLPAMAIATIFGANFFSFEPAPVKSSEPQAYFHISTTEFMIFCGTTLVTTIITPFFGKMYIQRREFAEGMKRVVFAILSKLRKLINWPWGLLQKDRRQVTEPLSP